MTWQSKAEKAEGKHPYPVLQGYFLSIICRNEVQGLWFLWHYFLLPFLYFVNHLESYFRALSDLTHTFSTSTGEPAACIYFLFTCASFMQSHCSNAPGTLQVQFSLSVLFSSLLLHGLQPSRLLCPWDFPGKNTGVGCHFLLQGIFMAQGLNTRLLHLLQEMQLESLSEPPGKPWCICACAYLLSHGWLFVTPWTVAHKVPLSMVFARQEHWSGLPFPSLVSVHDHLKNTSALQLSL